QKTELSPPTHQTTTTASIVESTSHSSSSSSREAAIISTSSNSSSSTLTTATNTNNASSSSTKQSGNEVKVSTSSSSVTTHKTNGNSSSSTSVTKEREERYAAAQAAIAAANGGNMTTTAAGTTTNTSMSASTTTTSNNAPSLYVSVPLSNANVPGINIPANTTTAIAAATTTTSTTSSTQLERQNAYGTTSNNSTPSSSSTSGNMMQSPAHHGVIYQSGKSPTPTTGSLVTAGVNLTATTTESGNLKISYDKQSSRVTQLQEQENAPVRRSRTPDSGIYSTSSSLSTFNVSNASTVSSCSNSSTGGLKFSYEPQANSNSMPANFESNVIKDSPPSSPGSEAGSMRKRGRKAKDMTATNLSLSGNDLKDVKVFQNGNQLGNGPSSTLGTTVSSNSNAVPTLTITSAAHMLGNQINPNSSVAQKLSDQLSMEIQDHSIYTPDSLTPQYVGVPFPGKLRNTSTPAASVLPGSATGPGPTGPSPLATMFGSGVNGNLSIPQSLEQLLERQWEQGSQFLMEQAQHFDIASLLSCLHQLQTENVRLEEHVASLIARRDHLLAVNARLAIPLNANTTPNQVILNYYN
uniref:Alhambra n=1 Tax=Glossina brevipalpis TaxID=37001 RepID=A0A1A9WRU8_9MUSC